MAHITTMKEVITAICANFIKAHQSNQMDGFLPFLSEESELIRFGRGTIAEHNVILNYLNNMSVYHRTQTVDYCIVDSIVHDERYNAACAYALMGDSTKAFQLLEEELKNGYSRFNHIRHDPDFASLHGTRFDSLLITYEAKLPGLQATAVTDSVETTTLRVVEVPFTSSNGVTKVDCTINGLPLNFIFDTGASDVSISQTEASFMFKNGYLSQRDVIGKKLFRTADGRISVGTTFILNHINFGGLELTGVRASVVGNQKAPLLLGQTVLKRLGKIEIDNERRVLKITTNQ